MARLLVVEDDPIIQVLVREVLVGAGYEVAVADDGESGLEQVRAERPDLMVLDVMMPGIDGYEVLAQVRGNPETAELPVVMLTALNSDEDIQKGFAAGANDYVTKPFQAEELLASVSALVAPTRA